MKRNLTTTAVYFAHEDRFIESHRHYDTLGNVIKTVDALGR
ncbi:MAG TPA: hypothetical protein VLU25_21405 [Acidobacteriota bacterium]|nr:hypothetical protein [Acidobacteriota bacterium]